MNDVSFAFLASRIFVFLIQPINLILVFLLIGIVAGWLGWHRVRSFTLILSFFILAMAGWTSLGALMLNPLEERFTRPAEVPDNVAGIIVLGGGLEGAINLARGGYEINSGGDRYLEAAALARRFPDARIVVSGGTGTLLIEGEGDADTSVRLFAALGIPASRLVLDPGSRNTFENVENIRELITPGPDETWLLVTSAFHVPRAMGLFRKVGFPVTPWPVDYRTSGREGVGILRDNPADALATTTLAIREWLALISYKFTGRIDSVFPGPLD